MKTLIQIPKTPNVAKLKNNFKRAILCTVVKNICNYLVLCFVVEAGGMVGGSSYQNITELSRKNAPHSTPPAQAKPQHRHCSLRSIPHYTASTHSPYFITLCCQLPTVSYSNGPICCRVQTAPDKERNLKKLLCCPSRRKVHLCKVRFKF